MCCWNVYIGTSTPSAALHVVGGFIGGLRSATSPITTTAADYIILVGGTGPRTVSIATVTKQSGKILIIKEANNATGTITITDAGGGTFDGAASLLIAMAYGVYRLTSDGTNWFTF